MYCSEIKKRAFSLVELLVVITILATLLSILLPSLHRVRNQSKDVLCRHNQRQWGLFFGLFLSDNEGKFTGLDYHKWMDVLDPYAEDDPDIYFCPMAVKDANEGARGAFAAWNEEGRRGSYGTNYWIRETPYPFLPPSHPSDGWWKTFDVKNAAAVPVLMDSTSPSGLPIHDDPPPDYDGQPSSNAEMKCMRFFCINRHKRGVNGLFMDFSVQRTGLKQLWGLHWHRNWNPADDPPPAWPDWMR